MYLSVALLVGRLVSPNTVLQRDLREREVIFSLSPNSETTVEVLQNPLTTLVKVDRRLYLYKASNRRGTRTCQNKSVKCFNRLVRHHTFLCGSWQIRITPSESPLARPSQDMKSCKALTSDLVLSILPVLRSFSIL